MEEWYQQKLRKNRTRLVSDMMPEPISDVLFEKGLISQDELDSICINMLTPAEKNRKLLNIISSKGPNGYKTFVDSLASDFPWLQTMLNKTSVDEITTTSTSAADSTTHQKSGCSAEVTNAMINGVVSQLLSLSPHSRWKFLGRALTIPESILSDIEFKHPKDLRERAYMMLALWRQEFANRNDDPVETLCDALSSERMNATVEIVRSMRPIKVKAESQTSDLKTCCTSNLS